MTNLFEKELEKRVLVFDGGMGTTIHGIDLTIDGDYRGRENCPEILVQSRPDVVQSAHESFLEAGADAVETNTFGANKLVFAEFDLVPETFAINKAAAEIARASCEGYSTKDKPRFVIGSIGPGTRLVSLGNVTWDEMFESYKEQVRGLVAGGVDALLIETVQDVLQAKCAVAACLAGLEDAGKTYADLPIMVQVTIETTGTMLLGTEIAAAANALAMFPIMSLGLNCATGPTEMSEHVRWLGQHWDRRISVIPNAGLPVLVDGHAEYPLKPSPFVEAMSAFIEKDGVNIVGGCCGTTPDHIRELTAAVGDGAPVAVEKAQPRPGCSSLYQAVDFRQDTSFLIVGERTNASGSRAFKRLLESEDWDGAVSLAREQVREGSHVIDVNVDYAGRDGPDDMQNVVARFVRQTNVPLMLDSTQSATIEAGLKQAGGKCIINSANLEDGEEKFGAMCRMARTYGTAIVLGTIDEDEQEAMARTADRKLAIAERLYDLATEKHGIAPSDILFDPLVLPISTGLEADRRSALETIEGVRRISQALPEAQTTCGLSNVSFGLKSAARLVLNSVFLGELLEAGLTSAIVHSSKILPRNKITDERWEAALDLIHDRRDKGFDPLERFIELFDDQEAESATDKVRANLSLEERLQSHIIDGEKQELVETLDAAREKYSPLEIINDHLLAGMKVVGELFGSGKMQLPFVLQSAEVMKASVAHLEQYMETAGGESKGKIVIATVKGDVHDIGKNLVDIILSNNGYTVYNLGIKQPIANIISEWRARDADAIGLSGLLVKSVMVMEENLRELNKDGIRAPVLVGGAALSRAYAEGTLREVYEGELFYGQDAFEGLRLMDQIVTDGSEELTAEISERVERRAAAVSAAKKRQAEKAGEASAPTPDSPSPPPAVTDIKIPNPPFWGTRIVEQVDLDEIFRFINRVALFRGQWGFKKAEGGGADYDRLVEDEIEPILRRLEEQSKLEAQLAPKVAYGYFPANSSGDDVVVYDPDDQEREIERFNFPRQAGRRRLCIADFFRPAGSGKRDVIGMMCVTVGSRASEVARELFEGDEYSKYLYFHGFSVETAEALAELWHKRMRQELGIAGDDGAAIGDLFKQRYRGSRYSFGYPACPELADQEKLFRLLDPSRIGCVLTENWQIDPEQSTSAIIVHHPTAKYFVV